MRKNSEKSGSAQNLAQDTIARWLKSIRFRKKLFGGVDEADVWKKIGELNTLYEMALLAERSRYNSLLLEHGVSAGYRQESAAGQEDVSHEGEG